MKNEKILMIVYQDIDKDNNMQLSIKSKLSTEQLKDLVSEINSLLHIEDDIEVKKTTDNIKNELTHPKSNIYCENPDLMRVDKVLEGSIIDPIKK